MMTVEHSASWRALAGIVAIATILVSGCAGPSLRPVAAPNVASTAENGKPIRRLPVPFSGAEQAVQLVALQESIPSPTLAATSVSGEPNDTAGRWEGVPPPDLHQELDATQPTISMDLTGVLASISGDNPIVAHAAARYDEAYARLAAAKVLWVPSLRAGLSFNHHDGNLQNSTGTILDADRSSLQAGLGLGAVGAGTSMVPGVVAQFHSADAIFQPNIAGHTVQARGHAQDAVLNDTLLQGALAYLELLRAEQLRAIAAETEQRAAELARLTDAYAQSGQGVQSDADRAKTEAAIRTNDRTRAEEAAAVANARLLEVLSADPEMRIVPLEPTIAPIDLIDPELSPGEMLSIGLSNRPELSEARHLVCEAVARYQRDRYAPLLPSVLLGLSQSTFGGGVGSTINDSHRRFDFDAIAYWELRNFGFGERAIRDERRAVFQQRIMEEARLLDRVAREINEAQSQVRFRKRQIEVAQSAVTAANQSFERNSERIRQGAGLPIEVLQSIQALDAARREYVRSVVDYNAAQFQLHRAVGWAIR